MLSCPCLFKESADSHTPCIAFRQYIALAIWCTMLSMVYNKLFNYCALFPKIHAAMKSNDNIMVCSLQFTLLNASFKNKFNIFLITIKRQALSSNDHTTYHFCPERGHHLNIIAQNKILKKKIGSRKSMTSIPSISWQNGFKTKYDQISSNL